MIVRLNDLRYTSDVQPLIKAFYPHIEVKVVDEADECDMAVEIPENVDRHVIIVFNEKKYEAMPVLGETNATGSEATEKVAIRNCAKRLVYRALSEETGRDLPWGSLTGIRPTRIPLSRLEKGIGADEIRRLLKQDYFVSQEKIDLSLEIAERENAILSDIDCKGGYSLYVGIPFCPSTCLYCSFASNPITAFKNGVGDYLDALEYEIRESVKLYDGITPDTVYIGGGTPTALSASEMDRLLGVISEVVDISRVKEFTVESGRPDSITEEKLQVMKEHNVSRISVNPQTMKDETLRLIGRHHTVKQTLEAFSLARKAGFDNINMDIILGLPEENIDDVKHTLEVIEKLSPDSLTVHSLALKRASKLGEWMEKNGSDSIVNTDEIMELCQRSARTMEMKPYYLYRQKNMAGNLENVGYAREDCFGLYNILMMEEVQSIIACGAGTITKRVYPTGDRIERCDNVKDVKLYIEKIDEMIERKRNLFTD